MTPREILLINKAVPDGNGFRYEKLYLGEGDSRDWRAIVQNPTAPSYEINSARFGSAGTLTLSHFCVHQSENYQIHLNNGRFSSLSMPGDDNSTLQFFREILSGLKQAGGQR